MLVTFARLESQTIGLRVSAQAEQRARMGQPWRGGRYRPYGYERDGLTVIGEEAEIIEEIADRLLGISGRRQGEGEVVRWLNDARIPAPAGGQWNRGKLRSLMRNPRLAGWRRYRGEILDGVEAAWPPILDEGTFQRLGRLFDMRAQPGRPAVRWLVSGIVICGAVDDSGKLCGSPLEVRGHEAGTRYVCDRQAQRAGRDKPGCGKVTVVAEPVDELVAGRVLDRLAGPRLARLRRKLDTAELGALAKRREEDRQALVEAAHERYVIRTLAPPVYLQIKGELDRRIAEADRRLDEDTATEVLASLPRLRADLDRVWEAADIERRREIVRAVVDRVVVQPASRRGAGLDPDRVVIPPDAWRV
jgi:site-specific DNA recombinase